MTTRRTRTLLSALLLAVAAGCSGGDSDGGGDDADEGVDPDVAEGDPADRDDVPGESEVTLTFAPDAGVTEADLEQAVAVVERRIEALDVDATVAADADEATVVVGLADDDPDVADEVTGAVEAQGELRFRPVLATDPSGEAPLTPAADDVADAEVWLADEEGVAYGLGPTGGTGAMVESAEARVGSGNPGWEVALVFHPGTGGIATFNRMAAACSEASATCPTTQLAIVLDSVVQSAPTIQQPSFERDQIVISGEFGPEDARELAAVLEAGALPFALTRQP